jgi:hypothetical protein
MPIISSINNNNITRHDTNLQRMLGFRYKKLPATRAAARYLNDTT